MNALLDTHVLLWWLIDSDELGDDIKYLLDHEPGIHLSAVSGWEIAIKQSLDKLHAPPSLADRIERAGFRELPVTLRHAAGVRELPLLHRDPFDRMLIAQARAENLTLMSREVKIRAYDVSVLVV